jgi:predicted homoserine dehydrogenase-like protein
MELVSKLKKREEEHKPIAVGIVGCGQMGSGLAHAINQIQGMAVKAIADIAPERGIDTFVSMGFSRDQIVVSDAQGVCEDALVNGKRVVSANAELLTRLEGLEANVEATGVTDVGARVAYSSILNNKPIIMLNVETDVTVGVYLNHLARKMGSVYTLASGDEPGVCKMLFEQAILMGFEVVCLAKGKNNYVCHTATPESCADEAASKGMNPKILASFQDGTKTMVEMAAVSNATGLLPDVPGMYGPKVEVEDLLNTFIPKRDGGIFERCGTVDYSTGKIAPGVFAIVYSEDVRIRKDMKFITGADGPYYLHLRPYHLCDLETPQSIAEAVLLREVTVTAEAMNSEVVCVAKRDLKVGEKVSCIGSADIYGMIYTYREARALKAIPVGIAAGGHVAAAITKGSIMTEDNFTPDPDTFIYRMRRMQDALFEG